MKVTKTTARKIGLLSSIITIFGSVVGVGIFFKNGSVFKTNGYNPYGVLFSWFISIILVLCMALSFGQITSCKVKGKNLGLGSWVEQYCGKKFGNYVKVLQPIGYYLLQTFVCIMCASEAIVNTIINWIKQGKEPGIINFKNQGITILGVGFALIIIFLLLNYFLPKFTDKFSLALSYFKFLPMLLVICFGIIGGITNAQHQGGLWTNQKWDSSSWINIENGNMFSFKTIMVVPSILLAFEGYLIIGNLTSKIDKPEKNVPLSIVIGVILISILYLALTICCITAGTGNVYHLMDIVFGKDNMWANLMNIMFSSFLFICVLSVSSVTINCLLISIQDIINCKLLYKSQQLLSKKTNKHLYGGLIYSIVLFFLIGMVILVPTILFESDQIYSCLGDCYVTSFYLIYGIIIFASFINEFTQKVNTSTKIKGFKFFSFVGGLTSILIFFFCCIYQYIYLPIKNPNDIESLKNNWCFFVEGNHITYLKNWQGAIMFWSITLSFFALPFINNWLIKIEKAKN